MPNTRLQNARDILPKGLLSRLRKYCTGLVYVPAPQTENDSHEAILRLHKAGRSPRYIARTTGVSAKWARHIVADARSVKPPKPISKLCRAVPMTLLRQIQEHVVGRLYVPPRRTKKAARNRRMERLFEQGLSVSEIARRMRLSQRQVYRLKKAWTDSLALKELGGEDAPAKAQRQDRKPRSRAFANLCHRCGRPMASKGESCCDLCRTIEGGSDGDVIILGRVPIVFFDPKF